MSEPIHVVGAVIVRGSRVLAARRPDGKAQAGLWEFPGGKVEAGELPETALVREIREELGCEIDVAGHISTVAHEYDFGVVQLETYFAEIVAGEPSAIEHSELRWLSLGELRSVEWAPADVPTVECIIRQLSADPGKPT